eukprot:6940691-Prymnesium_polylepis.1
MARPPCGRLARALAGLGGGLEMLRALVEAVSDELPPAELAAANHGRAGVGSVRPPAHPSSAEELELPPVVLCGVA